MNRLLEDEMKRDLELKKHSPNVVARLMGLDGLPPQKHPFEQRKRVSGNFQGCMSPEVKDPRSDMYPGHQSHRKISKGEQEFKDVYEVFEMSKSKRSFYPSLTLNSQISEAEMAFIKQKFMDAKRLSTDERLLGSREFNNALNVLDSNKDLLVKYLQQPDALFTKHVHDLHVASQQSHCSRIGAMNSSDIPMHHNGGQGFDFEKVASQKSDLISPQDPHTVPLTWSVGHRAACKSRKSPKWTSDGKVESAVLPRRIVVLKPNLWKTQDATETLTPRSSHEFPTEGKSFRELHYIRSQKIESPWKKQLSGDVGLSGCRFRKSRVMSKVRKMRNSMGTRSTNFFYSESGAYIGEVSSSSISGNESACEYVVTSANSINSFVPSNRYKPSRSRSTESSMSREAKKRLSEKWNMTHKCREVGVVSRGSTLGEMLAIPDREDRTNVINNGERISGKLSRSDGLAGWLGPLGISSRDGWKDGSCVQKLPRSRSLPASSAAFANPKNSKHIENIHSHRYLIPKDAMKREKNKVVKGNLHSKDVLFPPKLRPSKKKYHSSHHKSLTGNDRSAENNSGQEQQKINLEVNGPFERISTSSERSIVTDDMVDVGHHHITISFETPEVVVDLKRQKTMSSETDNAKSSSHMLVKGDPSNPRLDHSGPQETSDGPSTEDFYHLQHSVTEQESSGCAKEADQPSPLSVLDAFFTDDISPSSECFESLSADLHALRMQLQLLKSVSDECIEGSILVSSDEDVDEGSVGITEQKSKGSWISSYLNDVLSDSGFDSVNLETFTSSCHSPGCPISPMVYEKLEQKYSDTCLLISERKLLFDLINSGPLEIYHQLMDQQPWVRPSSTRFGLNWSKEEFINLILESLENQEKNIIGVEMILAKEPLWLDLGDETNSVGKYMEKLLIDELVLEVVTM